MTLYYRCVSCGRTYFEKRGICRCGGEEWRETEIQDEVEVCTELRVTPAGFPESVKFCFTRAGDTRGIKVLER